MDPINYDMDDLFNKAGKEYPLRTDNPDWDAVLGKLEQWDADVAVLPNKPYPVKNNRRSGFLLLLLLLIPLGWYLISLQSSKSISKNSLKNTVINQPGTAVTQKTNQESAKPMLQRKIERTPIFKQEIASNNNLNPLDLPAKDKTQNPSPSPYAFNEQRVVNRAGKWALNRKQSGDAKDRAGNANSTESSRLTGDSRLMPNETQKASPGISQTENSSADLKEIESSDFSNLALFRAIDQKPVKLSSVENLITTQMLISARKGNDAPAGKSNNKKAKESDPQKQRFTVGLLLSPDRSSIRSQSVKALGYGVGAMEAYHFNKKLSVESGLLWDNKQYYTSGGYFNKSKTMIPSDVNLVSLNGNCSMFEIPLLINYSFAHSKSGQFFISTGLSAYLMKKESYDYSAEQNGVSWPGSFSYKNTGNSFFSILSLSAGYDFRLNKHESIRIAPYFKIPLGGVGIGNLPISSLGIYFGILHSFR